MKNFIYKATTIGAICIGFGQIIMAQPSVAPVPPATKSDLNEKGDQTEIIIRQKGDKDAKITLEIKNGKYFINGKPLEKFDDQNIVVEKREMDDDVENVPNIIYPPSPFRVNPWDQEKMQKDLEGANREQERAFRELNDEDMQRKIRKSIQFRMNTAFLGVSSRKSDKGGATVLEVTVASPAEKAGIKKGDIITKLNDIKIESPESLFEAVHNYKPGDKVKIVFIRDGKEQSVTATLDKSDNKSRDFNYNYKFRMPQMPEMRGMEDMWNPRQPKLGLKAQDAEDGKGVNILEVQDSSAASKAGLQKGDIILQYNGNEVNSTNELIDQIREAGRENTVKVRILRGGATTDIVLKIPRKLKTAEL